jgi:hypothetical protein
MTRNEMATGHVIDVYASVVVNGFTYYTADIIAPNGSRTPLRRNYLSAESAQRAATLQVRKAASDLYRMPPTNGEA